MSSTLNGTLARSAVSANAIQQLRHDIITRRYPQDSRLTEQQVCDNYGISRSPARAIMQQLEKEGMLRMLDNGCKQIITFTKKDMFDLYTLRNYLEMSAVKSICRAEARNYTPLVEMLQKLETLKDGENDHLTADIDFHRAVPAKVHKRFLLSTYAEQFIREFDERHNGLVRSLISEDEQTCLTRFREHHDYALNKAILVMDEIEAGRLHPLQNENTH